MTELNRSIFSGMQVLIERNWVKNLAIIVEESLIKAIIPADMIKHHLPAKHHEFPSDYYLSPGFIDLHVHGVQGKDVMDGEEEALKTISRALAAEGVTGFLATTMTAEKKQIDRVLKLIPEMMQQKGGAAILGVHLEGPFLAKAKMGAQCDEHQCAPDVSLMKEWQEIAKGTIKIVTLAPELSGALHLIQCLHSMHVIASIGHTNATYEETNVAIAAGCSQATHLFNAMSTLHQREPNAVGALLLSDKITAELIVDGIHLHPAIVDLCYRLKGKHRLLLVTDAMRAKCLGNGQYELGGQMVQVNQGKATLSNGTLAGSTLQMQKAIYNMMQFTQCSLADAIYLATENPARVLELDNRKGTIAIGKDADLVIMDASLNVKLTMREGKVVFSS